MSKKVKVLISALVAGPPADCGHHGCSDGTG